MRIVEDHADPKSTIPSSFIHRRFDRFLKRLELIRRQRPDLRPARSRPAWPAWRLPFRLCPLRPGRILVLPTSPSSPHRHELSALLVPLEVRATRFGCTTVIAHALG